MKVRRYSELIQYQTYEDRLNYLRLYSSVGRDTFGFDRYLNQKFYRSEEWKKIRREVILRDNGNDLGLDDCPIQGRLYVHHMNPMTVDNLVHSDENILNPEFLITVSHETHNLIHYGFEQTNPYKLTERRPNDTSPWRGK